MDFVERISKTVEIFAEIVQQFQQRLLRLENQKTQTIRFQRVHDDAILPKYEHPDDSGMDVHSLFDYRLYPNERFLFLIGWKVQVPEGYELQVRPKSGLALKYGLTVLNTPGTIDSSYRGEIGVILINLSSNSILIRRKQKIAQLVLCPVIKADIQDVESLDETNRNGGGFGSTGI